MHTLAMAGFQQTYTYFTWRNTKEELEEFLTELATRPRDFRPNFFVNTPDILTEYLQFGGRAAYKVRAAIAATRRPTWGVYAGYELYENVARPGAKRTSTTRSTSTRCATGTRRPNRALLAPYLTRLNAIRREHPALGSCGT